jgi:predicted Fe-Mo cluster-binding NifX family protein
MPIYPVCSGEVKELRVIFKTLPDKQIPDIVEMLSSQGINHLTISQEGEDMKEKVIIYGKAG